MNLDAIKSSLYRHEGENLNLHKCPADKWTIGVGHNLEDRPISKRASTVILEDDIDVAIAELDRAFQGWRQHSDAIQDVLVELSFAMGAPKLAGFKKMWAALDARDYPEAANQLLDSKWATQVGKRAKTLAENMRAG